ncbi:MAG: V-type ATP synthase subunit D [Bacillota bacterium]|nr:V-type ATP synthase subunit D [Bacillota bacterium]
MEMRVSATRMELQKLKARVKMAKRGHKLLKDKRDELIKEFMVLIRKNKDLRILVEQKLKQAHDSFLVARAVMSPEMMEEALMGTNERIDVTHSSRNIMNVTVPVFSLEKTGSGYAYGYATTSGELDTALVNYAEVMPLMVELAQVERSVELLADEIEKTRRRVNALEYVLIPELEAGVKDISMKLAEMERSNASRLMKIKDIVRAH